MIATLWNTDPAPMHQDEFEALCEIVIDENRDTLDRMCALERLHIEFDREAQELPPGMAEQLEEQHGPMPARDDLAAWAERFREAERENQRAEAERLNELIGPC